MTPNRRREPIRGIGVAAARKVRAELGYASPNELDIEVLAYLRGALVRSSAATGSRANLLRIGPKGVIGVADDLTFEERRWAIAHELGHFEAHAGVSFVGLCSSRDMVAAYEASGREPEANAFAAELLMPEDLCAKRCDVAKVSWQPIRDLAEEFGVSITAAALRFLALTDDRVCVVCAKDGVVVWSSSSRSFGARPRRGSKIPEWTEAHSYFKDGKVEARPQTVSANAWLETAREDEDMIEHVFAMRRLKIAMSLLWRKS